MKLLQNPNNIARRAAFGRLFLWHLLVAFGIIFFNVYAFAEEMKAARNASQAVELYSAVGKRDPFVPLVTLTSRQVATGLMGVQNINDILIEGIILDPNNGSMVIANGSLLKEGQEDGGIKVLKIDEKGAFFSVNGIEGYRSQYSDQSVNGEK